jgi:hypothetical protein
MGSLSERCKTGGVLAATFFFASWSASIGRRRKTALVTTIAHQLTRYHPELQEEISKAIDANSDIFDKNLHTQMEVLVLTPLQKIARPVSRPGLQGAIIIDGLDECEAEQYHESSSTSSQGKPERRNAEDQREILQVLQAASLDPSFPFRIIIASRPERVFREFFDPENNDNATTFAQKLDLHEDYNADADITLFFQAQFNQIRRRYDLPSSWPPPEAFETLVANASGQFIYAATVIRFLDAGHREPPEVLLEAALKMHSAARKIASNPLEQLDALYIHILKSSPDPPLSVLWIRSIHKLNNIRYSYASNIELLLRTDPETPSSEVQHLLGNLHSLIRAPHPGNQSIIQYAFYHRSLFDFLDDPDRCRELYVEKREIDVLIWDGFIRVCASEFASALPFGSLLKNETDVIPFEGGRDNRSPYPESFLSFLARLPFAISVDLSSTHTRPTPASADWWVLLAISRKVGGSLWQIFRGVHYSVRAVLNPSKPQTETQSSFVLCPQCSWYRCKPACRIWSRAILRRLGSATWVAPGMWWPDRGNSQRSRFLSLFYKALHFKPLNRSSW